MSAEPQPLAVRVNCSATQDTVAMLLVSLAQGHSRTQPGLGVGGDLDWRLGE